MSALIIALQCSLVVALPAQAGDIDPLLNRDAPPWVPPRVPPGVSAPQTVSARVETFGTQLQYVALCLDGDGVDQLYIKVQQKDSSGQFGFVGFYRGEGAGGWPGMTGGAGWFGLPAHFKSADMRVDHDGVGNVKLTFSRLQPPGPDQVHERGGWVPRNGAETGIAGFTGIAAIDDFTVGVDGVCDSFNRPDGALGGDWALKAGQVGVIRDGRAFMGADNVRARFTWIGECEATLTCRYGLKRVKAKGRCDACPPLGDEFDVKRDCERVRDCSRKLRTTIDCPDGEGACKLKGKRSACR